MTPNQSIQRAQFPGFLLLLTKNHLPEFVAPVFCELDAQPFDVQIEAGLLTQSHPLQLQTRSLLRVIRNRSASLAQYELGHMPSEVDVEPSNQEYRHPLIA
jgi:hypothetical protein